VITVTRRKINPRTLQVTGVLLAGVALSSCALPAPNAKVSMPPQQLAVSPTTPSTGEAQSPGKSTSDNQEPGVAPETKTVTLKPQAPPKTERCHTSQLSGSLRQGDSGAGQRYADLVLRNSSRQTCTLYGYGGLQLIGPDGRPLPTDLKRTPNPGPTLLRLNPGDTASANLHWTAVESDDEPVPCQPTPDHIQVIPPDETDPLTVPWRMGPVCGHGSMDGSAYHR
jgi:hypothetical protein